jgi:Uma2 family endonuclease
LRLLQSVIPPGYLLRSEQPVTCDDSEPEPDISVVKGAESDFWEDHPHTAELVIEVCLSSHEYDRSKLRAYALAGVKECWLVLGPEKQIETYSQPRDGRFAVARTFGPGETLTSVALPGFTVKLDTLFAKK